MPLLFLEEWFSVLQGEVIWIWAGYGLSPNSLQIYDVAQAETHRQITKRVRDSKKTKKALKGINHIHLSMLYLQAHTHTQHTPPTHTSATHMQKSNTCNTPTEKHSPAVH